MEKVKAFEQVFVKLMRRYVEMIKIYNHDFIDLL